MGAQRLITWCRQKDDTSGSYSDRRGRRRSLGGSGGKDLGRGRSRAGQSPRLTPSPRQTSCWPCSSPPCASGRCSPSALWPAAPTRSAAPPRRRNGGLVTPCSNPRPILACPRNSCEKSTLFHLLRPQRRPATPRPPSPSPLRGQQAPPGGRQRGQLAAQAWWWRGGRA